MATPKHLPAHPFQAGTPDGFRIADAAVHLAQLCGKRGCLEAERVGRNLGKEELKAIGVWRNPRTGVRHPPGKSTIHRVLQQLDADALEDVLAAWCRERQRPEQALAGAGKRINGANQHGHEHCETVTLIEHESHLPIAVRGFRDQGGELAAMADLFERTDIAGRTVTLDALHTARSLTRLLVELHSAHYQDAVSFLRTQGFADRERLFDVGICAGGSHVALTAVTDKRLKKIAIVGGMLVNTFVQFTANGRKKAQAMLESANEARQQWYETGKAVPFDALGFDDGTAENSKIADQREGYDYYMAARAGAVTFPNYTHKTPEFFVEDNARHSARSIAKYLRTPTITIHGSKATTRTFSWLFHWSKRGPKKRVVIKGATHVDLYDKDQFVDQVITAAIGYFKQEPSVRALEQASAPNSAQEDSRQKNSQSHELKP